MLRAKSKKSYCRCALGLFWVLFVELFYDYKKNKVLILINKTNLYLIDNKLFELN
jgi:hypothetical protein